MKSCYKTVQEPSAVSVFSASFMKPAVTGLVMLTLAVVFVLVGGAGEANALTQQCFQSPEKAVDALIEAARADDEEALARLFGADSDALISSGDPVADQRGRDRFLRASEKKCVLETISETQRLLVIGERNYPFPIPLIQEENGWFFDTAAGKEELLNRRIGRNELRTIEVMQTYTEAQREYAAMTREEGIPVFARYLASHEGKKDGLYWPQGDNEAESPFGPLIAKAATKGYHAADEGGFADPFYGYYYTILTAQGEHAEGGAFDYIVNDKMVLGFALIAYPARYGASGIMTFMVNQEGIVYEKDFGEETSARVAEITSFDPDSSWQVYQAVDTPQ